MQKLTLQHGETVADASLTAMSNWLFETDESCSAVGVGKIVLIVAGGVAVAGPVVATPSCYHAGEDMVAYDTEKWSASD